MENQEINQQVENTIVITDEIKKYFLEISKWGKFLAIVGYIGMGFLVLLSLFLMVGVSLIPNVNGSGMPMAAAGFVYLLMAGVYFFPITYLYNYSVKIKQGLTTNDQQNVTSAFMNLKSLFKFFGIFTIVILSIYALILIVAVPMAIVFAL